MTAYLPNGNLRAIAALIAAYAIALQAVFVTLAPMQVQADGTIAVYCSRSANTAVPDSGDPAVPAPGRMQCVFCGACAAGAVILPGAVTTAYLAVERVVSPARASSRGMRAAIPVRDGPARAPPFSV